MKRWVRGIAAMFRTAVLVLAVTLVPGVVGSAPRAVAAEPAGTQAAVLGRWLGAQTNVSSWSAEFTQIRTLKALAQPLRSPGRLWYAAPDRFRWELGVPAQSIAIRRGDELVILSPKLRRAERYSLEAASRGPMKEAMSLLDTGFPRTATDFNRRFELLSLTTDAGVHHLQLQPRDAAARKFLPELTIGVASADFGLASTAIRFADGSKLETVFTNAVLNRSIAPSVFDPTPPEGYKIVSPASP